MIVQQVVSSQENGHRCVFCLTFPSLDLDFLLSCLSGVPVLVVRAGPLGTYAGAHRGAFRRGKR